MRTQITSSAGHLPKFVLALLASGWLALIIWANFTIANAQTHNVDPSLPFGVLEPGDGEVLTQDFAWHLLFLRGVHERRVEHPYQAAQQETLMRQMLPQSTGGMVHAYSPVAFVLAMPLLAMTGREAYLLYTVVCGVSIVLLYALLLRTRIDHRLQAYAFLVCAFNLCVADQLLIGQTALFTVPAVGALGWLLGRRRVTVTWTDDLLLALLFWVLCVKPNVALLPATLLIGERAMRPLLIAAVMLVVTWIFAAPYYGGWWTGLQDYAYLLNHYTDADFPPYLQRSHPTAEAARALSFWFSIHRDSVLVATVILVVLRWTKRFSSSVFFQGAVWIFLLLSPYVQSTELWILALLVFEGNFFRSKVSLIMAGKLILLALILNLRLDTTVLRWLLFAWIVAEGGMTTWRGKPPKEEQAEDRAVT